MAGLLLTGNSGSCTLVALTAKTILQIKMPANQRGVVRTIKLFGESAAGGTDVPCKVRLTYSTTNFGTGSAVTPGKNDPGMAETVQSVWKGNFSAEPTSPTDMGSAYRFQPQLGVIEPFYFGQEVRIPGGYALNVEVTSASGQTPTVMAVAVLDE